MCRFYLTTIQALQKKYVNVTVAYFIAPCHPQQDRRRGNHRFCTLCMFNMCLLFCDNKKWGGGGQTGFSPSLFFSPLCV